MSCKIIVFLSFFNFKKEKNISFEVLKSKFPVGSSAKIIFVSDIKALAIATLLLFSCQKVHLENDLTYQKF